MLKVYEAGHGLLLAYPAWLGALILSLGAGFLVYSTWPGARVDRRWLLLLISITMLAVGADFLTYRVALTDESGERRGWLRPDRRVDWADTKAARLEQTRLKGAEAWSLVVTARSGTEFDVPLGGLRENERERVVEFVTERVGH